MENILYAYCVCPHCVGRYSFYSPFASQCKNCGGKLAGVSFPFDPTKVQNTQKFKEFMDSLWAEYKA